MHCHLPSKSDLLCRQQFAIPVYELSFCIATRIKKYFQDKETHSRWISVPLKWKKHGNVLNAEPGELQSKGKERVSWFFVYFTQTWILSYAKLSQVQHNKQLRVVEATNHQSQVRK